MVTFLSQYGGLVILIYLPKSKEIIKYQETLTPFVTILFPLSFLRASVRLIPYFSVLPLCLAVASVGVNEDL